MSVPPRSGGSTIKREPIPKRCSGDSQRAKRRSSSRAAQPKRVRAFLDLAIARLHDSPHYVLSSKEVAAAQQKWARKPRK
jgi:hypothetical protein